MSLLGKVYRKIYGINIKETFEAGVGGKRILNWCSSGLDSRNFGDRINPTVFNYLSGSEVVSKGEVVNICGRDEFYLIGSILDGINSGRAVVCGAGFQNRDAIVRRTPRKIIATRGPLSQAVFRRHRIDCPSMFCDPAIVLPNIYPNIYQKKWDVGIIPHYVDARIVSGLKINSRGLSYKIIDILDDVESVVADICSSRSILSSSLHGIIVAHAYDVPAAWIELSSKVIGGSFKFEDYYESFGVKPRSIKVDSVLDLEGCNSISSRISVKSRADEFMDEFRRYLNN